MYLIQLILFSNEKEVFFSENLEIVSAFLSLDNFLGDSSQVCFGPDRGGFFSSRSGKELDRGDI